MEARPRNTRASLAIIGRWVKQGGTRLDSVLLRGGHGGSGGEHFGLHQFRRPHVHGETPGVVEEGRRVWELEADVGGEVVLTDFRFGFFEGPRNVVNIGPQQASEGVARE